MNNPIHWAILGPGKIAEKFASAFVHVPQAKLYAVASRDANKGNAFAQQFGIPKVFDSYEAMLADPQVDVVYIATPHPLHFKQALLCLKYKKAVLCEKPLTLNSKHTMELVAAAKAANTFLMEGMWSRFFPATMTVMEFIRKGAIGELKFLQADFGFVGPNNPEGRVLNLQLGGGAQLDVGVYPLFLALLICGDPVTVQVTSKLTSTGVDETTSVQLSFENGTLAHILSSIAIDTPKRAEIMGTKGKITIHTPWHKSQEISIKKGNAESETFSFPYKGVGFQFELQHVTECLQKGLKESELMTLDLSVRIARVADEILRQCGVSYPEEN